MGGRERLREAFGSDSVDEDGFTHLGRAAYDLNVSQVLGCVDRGEDLHQESPYCGGCSPALLAVAGYELFPTSTKAWVCVQILELLRQSAAPLVLPVSVVLPEARRDELLIAAKKWGLSEVVGFLERV